MESPIPEHMQSVQLNNYEKEQLLMQINNRNLDQEPQITIYIYIIKIITELHDETSIDTMCFSLGYRQSIKYPVL